MLISSLGIMSLAMTSCASSMDTADVLYLRVLNAGDYIYENDPDNGYDDPDLTEQYTEWINEPENKAHYFGSDFSKRVEIVYDTYDVNETMYNELKTGKSNYDLVCTSDYMIQKLAKAGMIQKVDKSRIPNYEDNASQFLIGDDGKLSKVEIDPDDPSFGTLNDFAIGYMRGTLGILFNPAFPKINDRSEEEVIEDFTAPDGWDVLWNKGEYYKGITSIKDSMRDTYAMGIAHALVDENGENEFAKLYEEYAGNYGEEYNAKLSEFFNRSDDYTIGLVQNALIALKDNIYGFEVDTGKNDIVTGKVGVNLAWSGDAVYSMDLAEDEEIELYYSIPSYVANIWFDGFTMLSNIEEDHVSAAYSFLDFLSDPSIASENMDYVGYTPFIAGKDIFDLVAEWYDPRYDEEGNFDDTVETVPYDLTYFFKNGEDDDSDYVVNVSPDQLNRQMRAQYPLKSDLPHLAIMQDFGVQNDKIVSMWENVKVNPLPIWVTIIVILGFVGIIGFLGSYKLIKKYKIKKRKALRDKD